MSASDERYEYHLTPAGWVRGSTKIDFAGWTHVDPPVDRLLTVTFKEEMSSSFSPMDCSADVEKHAGEAEIAQAIQSFGSEPTPRADSYRGWIDFLKGLDIK